ncbi:MAG: hypothetical protein AAF328_05350 [Planctomycetota bacterium]
MFPPSWWVRFARPTLLALYRNAFGHDAIGIAKQALESDRVVALLENAVTDQTREEFKQAESAIPQARDAAIRSLSLLLDRDPAFFDGVYFIGSAEERRNQAMRAFWELSGEILRKHDPAITPNRYPTIERLIADFPTQASGVSPDFVSFDVTNLSPRFRKWAKNRRFVIMRKVEARWHIDSVSFAWSKTDDLNAVTTYYENCIERAERWLASPQPWPEEEVKRIVSGELP